MRPCFLLVITMTTAIAVLPSVIATVQLWQHKRRAPRGQCRSEWEGDS